MRIWTRRDIGLPPERVFAALSDTDTIERQLFGRGAEIRRTDDRSGSFGGLSGAAWRAAFEYHGRRNVTARVAEVEPPHRIVVTGEGEGLGVIARIGLEPRPRDTTRVIAQIEARPKSLQTRILIQSLKLVRGRLEERLDARLAAWAAGLEAGADAAAAPQGGYA